MAVAMLKRAISQTICMSVPCKRSKIANPAVVRILLPVASAVRKAVTLQAGKGSEESTKRQGEDCRHPNQHNATTHIAD